jgi:hypothetical protein
MPDERTDLMVAGLYAEVLAENPNNAVLAAWQRIWSTTPREEQDWMLNYIADNEDQIRLLELLDPERLAQLRAIRIVK